MARGIAPELRRGVLGLAFDRTGTLWVNTVPALVALGPAGERLFPAGKGLGPSPTQVTLLDREGNLFIGSDGDGLEMLPRGGATAFEVPGLPVQFRVRIGLHTGPVVAGVIGTWKFAYDIWGDAVNIAARMESSGEAGEITLSETTWARARDAIPCVARGKVYAKGKGEPEMYFVARDAP